MGSQQRAKQADFDTSFQPAWQDANNASKAINKMENGDYNALANVYGLEMRDPTADVRLIEFCLAIPESQYLGVVNLNGFLDA
ncbi:hypothetical protein HSBAA_63480 [Vreelandella sulfidaeris]|uniref:Uncharacterized protein n=1 Tax=Vreelandella sulfidaeris TaxID=115553 RepID=A0A455UFJ7_9GAMM|nr:hypothetical protein HSBAA_63480 [Halomonas sulfidaeris]